MKKLIRKVVILSLAWLLVVQAVAPPLILAENMDATPSAVIETGDAYATAATTTITNTAAIDSTISATQGDIIDPNTPDINLTSPDVATPAASPAATSTPATPSGALELTIDNQATSSSVASAAASTGSNTQESASAAAMITGDAAASAYNTSITNTTLVDSTLQIALLTLFTAWNGNILIDPTLSTPSASLAPMAGYIQITNAGDVIVSSEATAATGNNGQTAVGDSALTTGNAHAVSSTAVLADTTLVGVDIFDFFVQNPWLWTGGIYNWLYPGSRQDPSEVIGRTVTGVNTGRSGCATSAVVQNASDVVATATAVADTGHNQQTASGDATLATGNAYSSASVAVVANSTLINSRYRLLSINLLAPWTGNLIVPYPDLAVSVSAPDTVAEGEEIPFTMTVTNEGYAAARPVAIGYAITNDTEPVIAKVSDEPVIPPGESISRTYTFPTAGRGGATIIFKATASTPIAEESTTNNSAIVSTTVSSTPIAPAAQTTSGPSQEIPKLSLSASNNIATFIYPGDTARYEAVVTNMGPGIARDTVFSQVMVAETGEVVRMMNGAVGDIPDGASRTIRFALVTAPTLPGGVYYTESVARGRSDNSTAIASNTVENNVLVRGRGVVVTGAKAAVPSIPEVLGVNETPPAKPINACAACDPGLWYLATATGSLSYLFSLEKLKRRAGLTRLIVLGLIWPLFMYGFYLLANPDCRSGLAITSADPWCRWLLPAMVAIYLLLTAGGRAMRQFLSIAANRTVV